MQFTMRLLIALLVGISTLPSKAQTTSSVTEVQIIERGIYRARTVAQISAPGTTGVINLVRDAQLITNTTIIPGVVGVRFGLRYVAIGHFTSETSLRLVITFPPGGLRNPETGQVIHQNSHLISVANRARLYREYHFENHWEIVPGLWHFEFWDGRKKLAEQRFCVLATADWNPMPNLSGECLADLLSAQQLPYSPS